MTELILPAPPPCKNLSRTYKHTVVARVLQLLPSVSSFTEGGRNTKLNENKGSFVESVYKLLGVYSSSLVGMFLSGS